MAGVAFKLGHSCISCSSCRFAHAGSCIWGPAGPWEVLHMNTHTHTQHWQLYVTQTDSTVHSYDKTGQLCTPTHSSGPLHERRSTPPPRPKTLPGFPYRHHTSQNTPYTHLTCRQTPHLSRRPLTAPSDYIKKSSPLSGLS